MKRKIISIAFAVLVPTMTAQAYQDGTQEVRGFIINNVVNPTPAQIQLQQIAQPQRRETAGAVQLGIEPMEPVADDSTELNTE